MKRHKYISIFLTCIFCLLAIPAMADNCSGLLDCFNDMRKAIAAAAGLGALTSLALDFIPFVGTGKGLYEAYTGRDMVTDERLEWWERALGVLPLIGPLAHVAQGLGAAEDVLRHADDIGDAMRHSDDIEDALRHADDVEDAARHADDVEDAARHADDVEDAARHADDVDDAARHADDVDDAARHADDVDDAARHADDVEDAARHADDVDDAARHADDADNAFKDGWTAEEIKDMPNGSRPDPSEYLNPEYISDHLSKFDDGASYLTPQRALDEWGRDMVGRPDGLYVIPSSEMDDLLKRADGDISVVEKELGIPEGAWQDTDINRIDIENPKDFDLRMPSGNEAAANDLWQPGGHTSEGIPEAVTDRIPAGSYTETPIFKSE